MFERKRHLREVIETKSKQIANRDKLIDGQRAEIHQCQEENKALYNENKDLRFNSEELSELERKSQMIRIVNGYIIETTDSEDRQARYEHELEEADRDYEDRVFDEIMEEE